MNLKNIKTKISQVKKNGYKNINFGGSEPTLYPGLFQAIEYAQSLGLRCGICTNGNLFSSTKYILRLSQLSPITIKIPFHSYKRRPFDYITGVTGSYERVLRGIENIIRYFKISQIDYSQINIKNGTFTAPSLKRISNKNFILVDIPISRFNYKDLPGTIEFLNNRNIKVIKIFPLVLLGRMYSNPNMIVGLDSIQPYLSKAVTLAKKLKMIYFLSRFPICILKPEAEHFIEQRDEIDYIKLSYCVSCRYNARCCGIGKLSLIAKYGKRLLKAKNLFPEGFFDSFFTERDISFIKKLTIQSEKE